MAQIHSAKRPKVVVVGGYNADLFVACSQLPVSQRIFMGGPLQILGGGRGANMAVAAARAGCDVTLVGGCGRDGFGGMARGLLSNERINLDFFTEIPHANTGTAIILTETSTGQSMIVVAESANSRITPESVYQARSVIRSADLVFTDLEIRWETAWATIDLCGEYGVPVVLDASACQRYLVLPQNDLLALVVQDSELLQVAGSSDRQEAIRKLRDSGISRNVGIIEGNDRIICSGGANTAEETVPVEQIVDRCGSVECACVWIGLGLLRKLPLADVCQTAAVAMSLSLGRMGGQRGMPTEAEVLAAQQSARRRTAGVGLTGA